MLSPEKIKHEHHLQEGFSEDEIIEAQGLNIPKDVFEAAMGMVHMIDSGKVDDIEKLRMTHAWEAMVESDPRLAIALDEIEDPTHISVRKRLDYLALQKSGASEELATESQ